MRTSAIYEGAREGAIIIPYPGKFDLRCDGVLCIGVDRAYHAPAHTTTGSTTIEKRRRRGVDREVPCRELRRLLD